MYIGIRARQRKWVLWGLVYAVPNALAWSSDAGSSSPVVLYSFAAVWVISSVHAFRARREYLMRLEALQRGGGATNAALRQHHEVEYGNHTQATSSSQSPSTVDLNDASEQESAFVSLPQQPPHPDTGKVLTTYDVSEISVLRKRLGRAAFSMKVIGFLSAVDLLVYFPSTGVWTFLVGLALSILILWCAVRLSKRLRMGDTSAAKLIALWWLFWVAENLLVTLPKALGNENFDVYSVIGMAIFTLPIYFVARGLLALRAYENRPEGDSSGAGPLTSNPWEAGGRGMKRHPVFVNKRSLSLYPLLLLVPLPWLFIQLSTRIQDSQILTQGTTQADLLGEQLGGAIAGLAIWLSLTVLLYRHARRNALLPATELSKRNPRPIILYLRSFLDDKIKMWARAANGRSFLERAVKITFEEVITDHLWRYGPVVGIGKPGDKLPPWGRLGIT